MKVNPSLIHRLFYPQVPAVLSSQYRERVSAMPVVSYASISDSPPLVAVACNPESYTCKLVLKSRVFSLSMLGREDMPKLGILASTHGGDVVDKLASAGLAHRRGTKLAVPVITEARASLECLLRSKQVYGDHLLIVGLVRAARADSSFTDSWDFRSYKPILYTGWRGGMTSYEGP